MAAPVGFLRRVATAVMAETPMHGRAIRLRSVVTADMAEAEAPLGWEVAEEPDLPLRVEVGLRMGPMDDCFDVMPS